MSSLRSRARFAGVLYLLMGIPGAFNIQYIPAAVLVRGDAAATARNITSGELMYRMAILSGLLNAIVWVFLVVCLYDLLKDVDRTQARLMVLFVSAAVAIGLANLASQIAPLILLSGADFLSVFTRPQLEALALASLRLNSNGNYLAMAFWGLWLFPFGVLVMKSRFFPTILGVLLIIGCFAYLTVSFTGLVFPAHSRIVNQVALPFYAIGEVAMVIWLLVRGARMPPQESLSS